MGQLIKLRIHIKYLFHKILMLNQFSLFPVRDCRASIFHSIFLPLQLFSVLQVALPSIFVIAAVEVIMCELLHLLRLHLRLSA